MVRKIYVYSKYIQNSPYSFVTNNSYSFIYSDLIKLSTWKILYPLFNPSLENFHLKRSSLNVFAPTINFIDRSLARHQPVQTSKATSGEGPWSATILFNRRLMPLMSRSIYLCRSKEITSSSSTPSTPLSLSVERPQPHPGVRHIER